MQMSELGDPPVVLNLSSPSLQMVVAQKLNDDWSPQQIAGWLKVEYGNDAPMRVSHETIYKSLFVQARGVLRKELISRLSGYSQQDLNAVALQLNTRPRKTLWLAVRASANWFGFCDLIEPY